MPFPLHFSSKGQAALEYIIILSLVLLLGAIILAITGFFPTFSYSSLVGDSTRYWQTTAAPIAIIDFTQSSTTFQAILENKASANILITSFGMTYTGTEYTKTAIPTLPPGGKYALSLTAADCSGKKTHGYTIQINYQTDAINGLVQKGVKPLYVQCAN